MRGIRRISDLQLTYLGDLGGVLRGKISISNSGHNTNYMYQKEFLQILEKMESHLEGIKRELGAMNLQIK